ncbi:hypothetical protein SK128_025098 [Halocaridina rubra]|uniref:Uncharacterized protein n=1 Tax=Halocaridina rubra TaxID=373956 RepID=A0AAN9AEJ0_HALRR
MIARNPKRLWENTFFFEMYINKFTLDLAIQNWTFEVFTHEVVVLPKAVFYLQTFLLQFWLHYSGTVCSCVLVYVVIIFVQGMFSGLLLYANTMKCAMHHFSTELSSLVVRESHTTENAIRAMQRFESAQTIRESKKSLEMDEDYQEVIDIMGLDQGKIYNSEQMKENLIAIIENNEMGCYCAYGKLKNMCDKGIAVNWHLLQNQPVWNKLDPERHNISELLTTLPGYLKWILFAYVVYLLVVTWKKLILYVASFLMHPDFENFVGRAFRQHNMYQTVHGEDSIFPLKGQEKEFLQHRKNKLRVNVMNIFIYAIFICGMWYCEFHLKMSRQELNLSLNSGKTEIIISRMLHLTVLGSGEMAEKLQQLSAAINEDYQKRIVISFSLCIKDPRCIPHAHYVAVLIFYLVVMCEISLGMADLYIRILF